MERRGALTEMEHGAQWRADEIGRLYDRIGEIREYLIGMIRELESTGQIAQLQRVLDETQAVINALSDRIEFLVEYGAEWYEKEGAGDASDGLRELWDYLQAEAELIEEWEEEHKRGPLPEIEHRLTQLHENFLRGLDRLDRLLKEKG
jgi:hypothetical protein